MVKEKGLGTVKRFGVRYGRRVRHKVAQIEILRFAKKKCPYCHAWRVKRQAVGIWFCSKCNNKFTGRAYTLTESVHIKEEIKKDDHEDVKKFLEEKKKKAEERKAQIEEQKGFTQADESGKSLNNEESE